MVNRRSCLYHLPDLMQIKYAFHGTSGAWFLYVDLRPSNDLSTPSFGDCVDVKEHKDGTASNPKVENSNANSSDVISVEGLIEKYFTSFSEVSNCSTPGPSVKLRPVQSRAKGKKKGGRKGNSSSNNQVVTSGDFLVKTPSQPLNALASINMIRRNLTEPPKRSKVGTRLVMASYSLGISPSRETVSSLCRSRSGKSSRSPLRIKCPIFDISGESDG